MSDQGKTCPICDEGSLHSQIGKNAVDYKGQTTELDLHYSVCDSCGSEQADASQTRDNKRIMLAFKKQVDGLMSGAEVRALRKRFSLSQAEAAKLFGGGPVAFSKYESDDVAQSEAMDRLLRLVSSVPNALQNLRRQAGLYSEQMGMWTTLSVGSVREEYKKLRVVKSSSPETDQTWKKCA